MTEQQLREMVNLGLHVDPHSPADLPWEKQESVGDYILRIDRKARADADRIVKLELAILEAIDALRRANGNLPIDTPGPPMSVIRHLAKVLGQDALRDFAEALSQPDSK